MAGMPLLVVAGLIERDGRVLLASRPAGGHLARHWEFPGGKLRPGEDPEAALRRELREELGVEVQVLGIFHVHYHVYDRGPVLLLTYRCRLVAGEPEPREGQQCRWLRPEELGRLPLAPADLPVVSRLQRESGGGGRG
jgi:8-oxo-dGTP diphosphatase